MCPTLVPPPAPPVFPLPPFRVIRGLLAQEGFGATLVIKQLYAGVAGAAMCSVVIGAVHFATYETAHRLILERAVKQQQAGGGEAAVSPRDKQIANSAAAVLSAFITAVVESPVEPFRHNQQAGIIKGDFMREMVTSVQREGLPGEGAP